jgi:hypothetical protein
MFSVILYQPYKNVVMSYKLFQNSTMITYISRLTSPRDTVLMWGAETSMNFFSRRSSPSRFVYQYPLYSTGYTNEKIINEFIQDIVKHKPHFIIDTKNPQCPFFNFPIKSEKIQAGIMNIKSHYRLKENIDLWTGFDSIPQNLTISPCTVYEYVNTKNIP